MELTPLEQKLLYLKENHDKMVILVKNLPLLPDEEDYGFKSVVREYVIIILRNFITLYQAFEQEPAMADKRALHDSLEPFWRPILDCERDIHAIRTQRLAHAADRVKHEEPLSEFLVNSKLPGSYGDLLFLMLCACGYAQYMRANFRAELEAAFSKEESDPDAEMPHKLSVKEARLKIREIDAAVVKSLQENGLAFDDST
jgi:hypothetical protein